MRTHLSGFIRNLTLLAILLSGALPLLSAEPGRYDGARWALLDPKTVLDAAAQITLAKYPDCDEATVDKKMVRVYRTDGTGEAQDETFTKILSEKGKRNNRTLALSFMLPYNTVQVVKLEILKPDGTPLPVDLAANSKEVIDDSQMSMNIYDPNMKLLRVNIPKLEIGDVVHSVTRTVTERAIIPGEFAEYSVLEGQGILRHATYIVYAPGEKPLKRIFVRDEIPGTITYTNEKALDGLTVHHWDVKEVPRMFEEPAMPSYENVLQRLLVSTTPRWHDVSKWYWELSKPHLDAATSDMKKTVEELTANAKTEDEKMKAVFYFVSKKVRYMGLTPEKDRPGFEPHDVNLTFDKKYGVCRDKAALLVSLLRTAGLEAFPVLINVGSKMDKQVPCSFFNHAIVAVQTNSATKDASASQRDYVLMDPTDENTRSLLPEWECDQTYLVCRPDGEDLKLSPVQPADENMMRVATTGTLSAAGALSAKTQIAFDGVNDNSYRGSFVRFKPDDLRRFFERALKRSLPGATLKSLKVTPENMLDVSQPIRAELEFSVDGLTASGNGKSVVSLPWIGKSFGLVNMVLENTGLQKRKYPLQTFVACGLKEQLSLKLDDAFAAAESLPSCSPVNDKAITYSQSFGLDQQSLNCSRELKLNIVEFSPAQYQDLRGIMETLQYDERKAPLMSLAPGAQPAAASPAASPSPDLPVESNAKVLESTKTLVVHDAHSATLRGKYVKRILTYSGKIREAELKLDFNPACGEAKLVRAVVTSKDGARQEISNSEINIMDAGWNAGAKRYTGGKILVANLPGVDIGSTIEVEYEITTTNKPFVSGFESFQLPDELEHKSFELTVPAGLKVQSLISGKSDSVSEKKTSAAGRQSFAWSAQNVKALPAESQLPPEWTFNPGVSYFAGDPAAYARDLSDALNGRSAKSTRARQLGSELARSAKTPADAAVAIRDFIAKSIRTAGPSFTELPLSELSSADTTLSDGYGHGADRAILYHAMLSAAGLKPEFVLASTLPPIAAITNVAGKFPLPNSFGTLLVRVSIGGQYCYLNDTDQYARLGSTPHDGKLAMLLPGGSVFAVSAAKDCDDKNQTVCSLALANDGKTRITIARHYFGTEFNGKHRYFAELPPEERNRYFQEIVSGVAKGARPVGDLVTKFDAYPGLEQFTVEVDKYTVVDGKYLYFDLPFAPSLFPSGADHRTLPLMVSRDSQRSIRTEIELPPGYRQVAIAPSAMDLKAPAGSGSARVAATKQPGKIILEHTLESAPAIVDPKDYPAMLALESTLGRKSSRFVLLQQ